MKSVAKQIGQRRGTAVPAPTPTVGPPMRVGNVNTKLPKIDTSLSLDDAMFLYIDNALHEGYNEIETRINNVTYPEYEAYENYLKGITKPFKTQYVVISKGEHRAKYDINSTWITNWVNGAPVMSKDAEYQVKKKSRPYISTHFRIGVAEEIPSSKEKYDAVNEPEYIRCIQRSSYKLFNSCVRIDLSLVSYFSDRTELDSALRYNPTQLQYNGEDHEIEIEWLGNEKGSKDKCILNELVYRTLQCLSVIRPFVINCPIDYAPILSKPRDIEMKDITPEFLSDYAVTLKLDGDRCVLFCIKGIFFINDTRQTDIFTRVVGYIEGMENCDLVLEGELTSKTITQQGITSTRETFHAFDVLNGPMHTKPLMNRVSYINDIIKLFTNFSVYIESKEFFIKNNQGSLLDYVQEILQKAHTESIENDGLIFQPKGGYVKENVLKWKPADKLTIDFKVSKNKLYVNTSMRNRVAEEEVDSFFKNSSIVTIRGAPIYNEGVLEKYNGFDANKVSYVDGDTLECYWDEKRAMFVVMRNRGTKEPNHADAAMRIWNRIRNPISEETISGRNNDIMRHLHNIYKSKMIQDAFGNNIVALDIGSGQGGDLGKWSKNSFSKIIAVEPDDKKITEFKSRLSKYDKKFSSKIQLIEDGAESDEVYKIAKKEGVNLITAFFSLTFFYKDDSMLNKLIELVKLLPTGGQFVGILLDGRKLKFINNEIANDHFKIQRVGENTINTTLYGTYVEDVTEYITDFKKLKDELSKVGFDCTVNDHIIPSGLLLETSQLYSDYQTAFVFTRKGHAKVQEVSEKDEGSELDISLRDLEDSINGEEEELESSGQPDIIREHSGDNDEGEYQPKFKNNNFVLEVLDYPSVGETLEYKGIPELKFTGVDVGKHNILHAIMYAMKSKFHTPEGVKKLGESVEALHVSILNLLNQDTFIRLDNGYLAGGYQHKLLENGKYESIKQLNRDAYHSFRSYLKNGFLGERSALELVNMYTLSQKPSLKTVIGYVQNDRFHVKCEDVTDTAVEYIVLLNFDSTIYYPVVNVNNGRKGGEYIFTYNDMQNICEKVRASPPSYRRTTPEAPQFTWRKRDNKDIIMDLRSIIRDGGSNYDIIKIKYLPRGSQERRTAISMLTKLPATEMDEILEGEFNKYIKKNTNIDYLIQEIETQLPVQQVQKLLEIPEDVILSDYILRIINGEDIMDEDIPQKLQNIYDAYRKYTIEGYKPSTISALGNAVAKLNKTEFYDKLFRNLGNQFFAALRSGEYYTARRLFALMNGKVTKKYTEKLDSKRRAIPERILEFFPHHRIEDADFKRYDVVLKIPTEDAFKDNKYYITTENFILSNRPVINLLQKYATYGGGAKVTKLPGGRVVAPVRGTTTSMCDIPIPALPPAKDDDDELENNIRKALSSGVNMIQEVFQVPNGRSVPRGPKVPEVGKIFQVPNGRSVLRGPKVPEVGNSILYSVDIKYEKGNGTTLEYPEILDYYKEHLDYSLKLPINAGIEDILCQNPHLFSESDMKSLEGEYPFKMHSVYTSSSGERDFFPYKIYGELTPEKAENMIINLQTKKGRKLQNHNKPLYFSNISQATATSTAYFKVSDSDYEKYDAISDYFNESVRVRCRYRDKMTPYEYFMSKPEWHVDPKTRTAEENIEIRNKIWQSKESAECTTFKPSLLVDFIKLYGATKILDPCAGWGDRMIGALSQNVDYEGYDPNVDLQNGYANIFTFFRSMGIIDDNRLVSVAPYKFEDENVRPRPCDLVFTSPPYFTLEDYSVENKDFEVYIDPKDRNDCTKWYNTFLKPMILKAWNSVLPGGHMVINIGNTHLSKKEIDNPKYDYVHRMVKEFSIGGHADLPHLGGFGIIGQWTGNDKKPAQPFFVWKKSDKIHIFDDKGFAADHVTYTEQRFLKDYENFYAMKNASYVAPSTGDQLRFLFTNSSPTIVKLRDDFIKKFINSEYDDMNKTIQFVRKLNEHLSVAELKDEDIYDLLHSYHKSMNIQKRNTDYRAKNRIKYVKALLRSYLEEEHAPPKYLDIGCNEGGITEAIGKLINAKQIDGCDIYDDGEEKHFNFHLLDDNDKYTLSYYGNKSKDVISNFMSLHHIEDIDTELQSINRILKDDGIYIIREHDLDNTELKIVLDIMHAFYDLVWGDEVDDFSFRNYTATYYSHAELKSIIERNGFVEVSRTDPVGLWRHYHAVYVKADYATNIRVASLFKTKVVDIYEGKTDGGVKEKTPSGSYTYAILGNTHPNPKFLRNILDSNGWKEKSLKLNDDVDFLWFTQTRETHKFDKLGYTINSVLKNGTRNHEDITNKYKLWFSLLKQSPSIAKKYLAQSIDARKLKEFNGVYIIRPSGLWGACSGADIFIVHDQNELDNALTALQKYPNILASKYIMKPDLYENRKYHLRMYWLVFPESDKGPFSQQLWNIGKIMTAKKEYTPSNWEDKEIHDTHGKSTPGNLFFPHDMKIDANKCSQIFTKMQKIMDACGEVIKTKIACYPETKYGFDVFGIDFMIDQDYNPILIEINGHSVGYSFYGPETDEAVVLYEKFEKQYYDFLYSNVISKFFPTHSASQPASIYISKDIENAKEISKMIPSGYTQVKEWDNADVIIKARFANLEWIMSEERPIIVNSFPDHEKLTNKQGLLGTLQEWTKSRSIDLHSIIPKSWTYSSGDTLPKINFPFVILKPAGLFGGIDIIVIRPSKIKDYIKTKPKHKEWVIQEYIDNPRTYEGRKYDIRVNLLMGPNGDIFEYDNIIMRVSDKPYTPPSDDMDQLAHITNVDLRKGAAAKEIIHPVKSKQDLKLCKTFVKEYIAPLIKDTIFSTHPRHKFYQRFGIDLLITDDSKIYLLEINTNPGNPDPESDEILKSSFWFTNGFTTLPHWSKV